MAITKDLSNIVIDLDNSTGTITDGSIYTSPTRNGVGVFVKVYKTDYSGARIVCTTTSNNSDPATDSIWTFVYSTDGWHQPFYVAVPNWAAATYAKYDAVYDYTNKIVYRSKVNSNVVTVLADLANTTNWEVISDPTSLCLNVGTASASLNLNSITSIAVLNTLLYPEIQKNFEIKTGEAFLEATSDYKRSQDVRVYELLGIAVDGIDIANTNQEYALGELISRRAISLIENC